jgi:hypothetical protein
VGSKARLAAIFSDDVVVDRVRIEGAVELLGAIIRNRTKHGGGGIVAVASECYVFLD